MRRLYECWKCTFKFHANDTIACAQDHVCPRCGVGTRKWIPTQDDKKKGTRWRDYSSGSVVRLGRERWQIFDKGQYRLNSTTFDAEKIDRGTPSFGDQPI